MQHSSSSDVGSVAAGVASLKRALQAWEASFERQHRRRPEARDVQGQAIGRCDALLHRRTRQGRWRAQRATRECWGGVADELDHCAALHSALTTASTYKEYDRLKARLKQQQAAAPTAPAAATTGQTTTASSAAPVAPAPPPARPLKSSSATATVAASLSHTRRTPSSSLRVSMLAKSTPPVALPRAASAAAMAAAALSAPAAPAASAPTPPLASLTVVPPPSSTLLGLNTGAPVAVMPLCASARHAHTTLKRKRQAGGLMARMTQLYGGVGVVAGGAAAPTPPHAFQQPHPEEGEPDQHAAAHPRQPGAPLLPSPCDAVAYTSPHDHSAFFDDDDDDMRRELEIEEEMRRDEQQQEWAETTSLAPALFLSRGAAQTAPAATTAVVSRSSDPFALDGASSDESEEYTPRSPMTRTRSTRPARGGQVAPAPAPSRAAGRKRNARAAVSSEDEEDESDFSQSDDDDASAASGGASSDDEDAPITSLMDRSGRGASAGATAAGAAPASAKASKAPTTARKARATKPVKEKTVRARTAVSSNYVRSDSKHKIKNGTGRAGKSAKALRKEKWRQSQGLERWKSKGEYARDQKAAAEDALYCEMLRPEELKLQVLKSAVGAAAHSDDDGTDDELERLREMERARFGASSVVTKADAAAAALAAAEEDMSIMAASTTRPASRTPATRAGSIASATAAAAALPAIDPASHTPASLRSLLQRQFRYADFRPGQLETITRVLRCHSDTSPAACDEGEEPSCNVLSILPTGGGKTCIYQMLSYILPGLTLVVSPLLSLMRDQLEHLPPFLAGAIWSSENDPRSVLALMGRLQRNEIKVLFISPEKLLSTPFQSFMLESVLRTKTSGSNSGGSMYGDVFSYDATAAASAAPAPSPGISLVVIDEVHCMAEWSHNFRNSYSRLDGVLHNVFAVSRILGLTATATASTTQQVCAHLRIPAHNIVRAPLRRSNLILSVSQTSHDARFQALVALLSAPPFKGLHSLVVYVSYQKSAEALARYLQQNGFPSCAYYHAGLTLPQRHSVQTRFMRNKLSIVVATCAFGMGLDKRDIRGVVHANLPRSFEAYIQEIGRAGRDGALSFCHAMWDPQDEHISRSLLYTNGVDRYQLHRLLTKIFQRKPPSFHAPHHQQQHQSLLPGDEDVLNRRLVYVALEVEQMRTQMELSEEVVGTILARLERTLGQQWVRLVSCVHSQVAIGFHKTNPKVLAHTSPVIRALLEQNHWIQRGATGAAASAGISFDHERAGTAFDAALLASSAAATGLGHGTVPDYNSAEFQQLKQQKGFLTLNLVEAAMECAMDVGEVQREIVRLKAAGELSVRWSHMAFLVQVVQFPADEGEADDGGGASHMHDEHGHGPGAVATLDQLVDSLFEHLQVQEEKSSEKLSIVAEALKFASLPAMRCAPADSVDKAKRFQARLDKLQLQHSKNNNGPPKAKGAEPGPAAASPAMEEEEEEEPVYFDLHEVMDLYFQHEDHSAFLQQLQSQRQEAEAQAAAARGAQVAPRSAANHFKIERELVQDVTDFVRANGDALRNPRELARIFHGLHAPSSSAQSRSTESAARFANARGGGGGDADGGGGGGGGPSISPWFGCSAWGRHRSVPFPEVLRHCEQILQEYKLGAGARLRAKQEEMDRKREIKRQKLAAAAPAPMLAPLARNAAAAAAPAAAAAATAATTASLSPAPVLPAPAAAPVALPAADEILIAASDDDEEEEV